MESEMVFSPYSSPSTAFLLQRRVLAWATETGSPATVRVRVGGRSFDMHKDPLASWCGYFSEVASGSDVDLPASLPGGSEAFELIGLFCYGDAVPLDPFNVAAVRCAAEFLGVSGLAVRCDLYINQVVLQSWDDALIVLLRCLPLLAVADELLVVSRCVESLAFMASMEILDPDQRRHHHPSVKELAVVDLWIKDLIALPLDFFRRIVQALRRQGMKEEKYVSPLILLYANKWVLSKKTHKFWATSTDDDDANRRASDILQGVVELLPMGVTDAIPVAFYFALLSRSIGLDLTEESRARLRDQVASHLQFACADDLPLPEQDGQSVADSPEVRTMEGIVSSHVRCQGAEAVAELWDMYLLQLVGDPKLRSERLEELIAVVPSDDRKIHDHLYQAINTYLVEHPDLCGEEKAALCGHVECRKLSQEARVQAVQNERMPIRFVVQALFVQQMHTQRAFADMLSSGELTTSEPLSTASDDASEYVTASFRIQALEKEILSLKQTLQRRNTVGAKEPTVDATAAPVSSSCIGRWGSQRIMRVFARLAVFGGKQSKCRAAVTEQLGCL